MQIAEIQVDPSQYASTNFAHETHTRTAGTHLSHILMLIIEAQSSSNRPDLSEEQLEAYRTFGFLFERVLFDILLQDRRIERVGELKQDGIIITPDALDLDRHENIEAKVTWRGMPEDVRDMTEQLHDPDRFSYWRMQMLAQCKGLNTLDQQLWTFFANGNYKDKRVPTLRRWQIKWTREEVERNWEMIYKFAKKRGMVR